MSEAADRKRRQGNECYYRTKITRPAVPMYGAARKRARVKGLEFSITLDDIVIPATCPLLGIPLVPNTDKPGKGSPSLDRIDSSKGYVKGNVWVISHLANVMKSNANAQELLTFAHAITRLHEQSFFTVGQCSSVSPTDGGNS